MSPLLCVSPSVHDLFCSLGECEEALTGTHWAGESPPWTLFWEMPFSLLTLDFGTGNDLLLGICLEQGWSKWALCSLQP